MIICTPAPSSRFARYAATSCESSHPNRIFAALRESYAAERTIAIADGGDLLSFARLGLEASMYLDSGAFGCLGVGVPYAIAAKLA